MYISILYICDENALAFCVTLPFTCTMVLQCFSVENMYLVCVLFLSCHFLYFSPPVFVFVLLHDLLLLLSNEVTQLLFVFV